jgi:hypothetical protein
MMESGQRQQYSDYLSEAIMSARTPPQAFEVGGVTGAAMLHASAKSELDRVNWSDAPLPAVTYNEDNYFAEHPVEPQQHAQHLLKQAFVDAGVLIKHAAQVGNQVNESPADLRGVLLRSKAGLLRVGSLPDMTKAVVFSMLNSPYPELLRTLFGEGIDNGRLMYLREAESSKPVVAWRPQVLRWMRVYREPGRGCPAATQLVTTENHKSVPIMHYLWDRLVEVTFVDEPTKKTS